MDQLCFEISKCYLPESSLSLDEALLLHKGRLSFVCSFARRGPGLESKYLSSAIAWATCCVVKCIMEQQPF